MKKNDKIFTDENGEKWKVIRESPCPRKSEDLLKNNFKISFEVNFELELKEKIKSHKHTICEKVDGKANEDIEKILFDTKDFGSEICYDREVITKTKVNINPKGTLKNFNLPENCKSFLDRHFKESVIHLFKLETSYIEKHLEDELKRVFLKLWHESILQNTSKREIIITNFVKDEEKLIRKRFTKGKYERDNTDFENQREKFIQNCFEIIAFLKRNRLKKIYQKDVANKMFPDQLNEGYQMFRDKMKKFKLDFKQLLADFEKV